MKSLIDRLGHFIVDNLSTPIDFCKSYVDSMVDYNNVTESRVHDGESSRKSSKPIISSRDVLHWLNADEENGGKGLLLTQCASLAASSLCAQCYAMNHSLNEAFRKISGVDRAADTNISSMQYIESAIISVKNFLLHSGFASNSQKMVEPGGKKLVESFYQDKSFKECKSKLLEEIVRCHCS